MRSYFMLFLLSIITFALTAQQPGGAKANYQLAARFSPKKQEKLLFSTMVDAHWLKKGSRFWYSYETTEGKKWYIVDPVKAEKKPMFDNARLAAELTKIIKDPSDAQHLLIDSIRFVKDEHSIQFEFKSTEDIEQKDTTAKKDSTAKKTGIRCKRKKGLLF